MAAPRSRVLVLVRGLAGLACAAGWPLQDALVADLAGCYHSLSEQTLARIADLAKGPIVLLVLCGALAGVIAAVHGLVAARDPRRAVRVLRSER